MSERADNTAAAKAAKRAEADAARSNNGVQQARPVGDDLMRAYQQLETEYQRCAQALATAAHDLRTPLAVVSGYIELLMSGKLGPLTDRQSRCLDDMYSSSQRLHRLITDFLTFSALQTGNLNLQLNEPRNMHGCLTEICGFWMPRFQ
jgi:signal transduction histidine kinase